MNNNISVLKMLSLSLFLLFVMGAATAAQRRYGGGGGGGSSSNSMWPLGSLLYSPSSHNIPHKQQQRPRFLDIDLMSASHLNSDTLFPDPLPPPRPRSPPLVQSNYLHRPVKPVLLNNNNNQHAKVPNRYPMMPDDFVSIMHIGGSSQSKPFQYAGTNEPTTYYHNYLPDSLPLKQQQQQQQQSTLDLFDTYGQNPDQDDSVQITNVQGILPSCCGTGHSSWKPIEETVPQQLLPQAISGFTDIGFPTGREQSTHAEDISLFLPMNVYEVVAESQQQQQQQQLVSTNEKIVSQHQTLLAPRVPQLTKLYIPIPKHNQTTNVMQLTDDILVENWKVPLPNATANSTVSIPTKTQEQLGVIAASPVKQPKEVTPGLVIPILNLVQSSTADPMALTTEASAVAWNGTESNATTVANDMQIPPQDSASLPASSSPAEQPQPADPAGTAAAEVAQPADPPAEVPSDPDFGLPPEEPEPGNILPDETNPLDVPPPGEEAAEAAAEDAAAEAADAPGGGGEDPFPGLFTEFLNQVADMIDEFGPTTGAPELGEAEDVGGEEVDATDQAVDDTTQQAEGDQESTLASDPNLDATGEPNDDNTDAQQLDDVTTELDDDNTVDSDDVASADVLSTASDTTGTNAQQPVPSQEVLAQALSNLIAMAAGGGGAGASNSTNSSSSSAPADTVASGSSDQMSYSSVVGPANSVPVHYGPPKYPSFDYPIRPSSTPVPYLIPIASIPQIHPLPDYGDTLQPPSTATYSNHVGGNLNNNALVVQNQIKPPSSSPYSEDLVLSASYYGNNEVSHSNDKGSKPTDTETTTVREHFLPVPAYFASYPGGYYYSSPSRLDLDLVDGNETSLNVSNDTNDLNNSTTSLDEDEAVGDEDHHQALEFGLVVSNDLDNVAPQHHKNATRKHEILGTTIISGPHFGEDADQMVINTSMSSSSNQSVTDQVNTTSNELNEELPPPPLVLSSGQDVVLSVSSSSTETIEREYVVPSTTVDTWTVEHSNNAAQEDIPSNVIPEIKANMNMELQKTNKV